MEFFAHLNEFYQMGEKPGGLKNLDVENSEICQIGLESNTQLVLLPYLWRSPQLRTLPYYYETQLLFSYCGKKISFFSSVLFRVL